MSSFTLYISESDSVDLYPSNKAYSFVVQLPRIINLSPFLWTCSVQSIILKTDTRGDESPVIVASDLCQESYCYGSFQTVLGEFILKSSTGWQQTTYDNPTPLLIRKDSLSFIKVSLFSDGREHRRISKFRLQLRFQRRR